MFTGIIEERGEVAALARHDDSARLTVRGPLVAASARRGDSVAVNGVCLTVTQARDGELTADVMGETMKTTALGDLAPGSPVNLERPVPAGGRLDGHIVQGHVDGTGTVAARRSSGIWDVVRIGTTPGLFRYIAHKGSIAVDGVSLTVSAVDGTGADQDAGAGGPWFEVSLIPETMERTTLGTVVPGKVVNLEVDVIAKYVEKLLDAGVRA